MTLDFWVHQSRSLLLVQYANVAIRDCKQAQILPLSLASVQALVLALVLLALVQALVLGWRVLNP